MIASPADVPGVSPSRPQAVMRLPSVINAVASIENTAVTPASFSPIRPSNPA